MQMFPQADSVVRTIMPAVLDVAGMRQVADELRNLGPVVSYEDALRACAMLSAIREEDGPDELLAPLVEDAAFWAEGAVLAALDGDDAMFSYCVGKVRAEMDSMYGVLQDH